MFLTGTAIIIQLVNRCAIRYFFLIVSVFSCLVATPYDILWCNEKMIKFAFLFVEVIVNVIVLMLCWKLEGGIPSELGELHSLQYIDLYKNPLGGMHM